MEQPIKKNKFLTLPDLAFGFVHKRSGNEISRDIRRRLALQTRYVIVTKLVSWIVDRFSTGAFNY